VNLTSHRLRYCRESNGRERASRSFPGRASLPSRLRRLASLQNRTGAEAVESRACEKSAWRRWALHHGTPRQGEARRCPAYDSGPGATGHTTNALPAAVTVCCTDPAAITPTREKPMRAAFMSNPTRITYYREDMTCCANAEPGNRGACRRR
jgi:hypothetical protein